MVHFMGLPLPSLLLNSWFQNYPDAVQKDITCGGSFSEQQALGALPVNVHVSHMFWRMVLRPGPYGHILGKFCALWGPAPEYCTCVVQNIANQRISVVWMSTP